MDALWKIAVSLLSATYTCPPVFTSSLLTNFPKNAQWQPQRNYHSTTPNINGPPTDDSAIPKERMMYRCIMQHKISSQVASFISFTYINCTVIHINFLQMCSHQNLTLTVGLTMKSSPFSLSTWSAEAHHTMQIINNECFYRNKEIII